MSGDKLERLGAAIREAETVGVPWEVNETKQISKHVQKTGRVTVISPFAAGAIRLLLFTGCRLREILNLRWAEVDFGRGMLHLPHSKTGKKSIVLNPLPSPSSPRCPALATTSSTATVQRSLDRI